MQFTNRSEAGKQLAGELTKKNYSSPIILALPRGGVVIGDVVANQLNAPLSVVLVRKLPHRFSPEFAMGAVAEDQAPIYSEEIPSSSDAWQEQTLAKARELIAERKKTYFKDRPRPSLKDKTVVIVDDGIATGLTMKAAVLAVKAQQPSQVIVAVPVAPKESLAMLRPLVDDVIVLDEPTNFLGAVGAHYRDFNQVTDEEVVHLLQKGQR